jgi:hypothetical protein
MKGVDHGAGLRSSAFLRKRSGLMTIIRNAMFRILSPQACFQGASIGVTTNRLAAHSVTAFTECSHSCWERCVSYLAHERGDAMRGFHAI